MHVYYITMSLAMIICNFYDHTDDSYSPWAVLVDPTAQRHWHLEFSQLEKIVDHIANGQIVDAIKYVREQTGFGLKEAKDVVDKLKSVVHYDTEKPTHVTVTRFYV